MRPNQAIVGSNSYLPEKTLSKYEQIRADIIKERSEALAKIQYYEDLNNTKEEIGFYNNVKEKRQNKDKQKKKKMHSLRRS